MTNPFAAAINFLKWDEGWREDTKESCLAAIRVLEAAGGLTENDRKWLLSKVDWAIAEYAPAIKGMVCPGAAMKDRFRALLEALPDGGKE